MLKKSRRQRHYYLTFKGPYRHKIHPAIGSSPADFATIRFPRLVAVGGAMGQIQSHRRAVA